VFDESRDKEGKIQKEDHSAQFYKVVLLKELDLKSYELKKWIEC